MADEIEANAPPYTRLYNRSTRPVTIRWGMGVIMPGEYIETDSPESFAPDQQGSAWTVDAEATQALLALRRPLLDFHSPDPPTPVSEPQGAPGGPSNDPPPSAPEPVVHIEPNGDVVTDTGLVIGHTDPAEPNEPHEPSEGADSTTPNPQQEGTSPQ